MKPEILIVDEILAVGDAAFQKKCEKRMHDMMNGGTTVILVSHSSETVRKICRHAAWINKGRLMCVGESEEVLERYSSGL